MNPDFNPDLPSNPMRTIMVNYEFKHRVRHYCKRCEVEFVSRKLFKKHLAEIHAY